MLDIHFVRENKDSVRENLTKRQNPEYVQLFDELVQEDMEYRKILQEAEGLRAKRNQLTQGVAKVKDNPVEKQKLVEESRKVGQQITDAEKKQTEL
ncbi:MAG: serine--tRNA ligase, partial [archaeon]